jgi:beta-glucosidase
VPIQELQGFERIHLASGETRTVSFSLTPEQLALIDDAGQRVTERGMFRVAVGGRQPSARDLAEPGTEVLAAYFEVTG